MTKEVSHPSTCDTCDNVTGVTVTCYEHEHVINRRGGHFIVDKLNLGLVSCIVLSLPAETFGQPTAAVQLAKKQEGTGERGEREER